MAVICFGMMAGDAIAQERGGRERGEGAQHRERPDGAAGERGRQRGQGAERRQRPSEAGGERGSRGSQFGGRGGQGGPGGFMRMFPVMVALDGDGNGEISSEEIKGAVAALKKLDKNKDGKLSEDELRPSFGGSRGGGRGGRAGTTERRPSFEGSDRPSRRPATRSDGERPRRPSRGGGERPDRPTREE